MPVLLQLQYFTPNHLPLHPLPQSKTRIPTWHFQDALLKLPIPKLQQTLERYIKSVTPLVTPAELEATQAAVDSFATGIGPDLDNELRTKVCQDGRTL